MKGGSVDEKTKTYKSRWKAAEVWIVRKKDSKSRFIFDVKICLFPISDVADC